MNNGVAQQIGTPREIYEEPQNKFVANFIGVANFIKGKIAHINKKENIVEIKTDYGIILFATVEENNWVTGRDVLA